MKPIESDRPQRIGVLISGGGTTLRNLIEKKHAGELDPEIALVISSNPNATGLEIARAAGIRCAVYSHREFPQPDALSEQIFAECRMAKVGLLVLGGFLRLLCIPLDYSSRVINIHPSLLPSFGGKGYYGRRVHEAVLNYGCKLTGCTVHLVDDEFDHGPILAQVSVSIEPGDSPETLAARVFRAECELYPQVINQLAAGKVTIHGRRAEIGPEPAK